MGCLGDNEDVSDGHFLELVYRCLWFLGHCCKYVMFHGEWPGLTNVLTAQNAEQARMPNAKHPECRTYISAGMPIATKCRKYRNCNLFKAVGL